MVETQVKTEDALHPAGFIKAEIIGPLGLSVTDAADALGVTRAALSDLLNRRSNLSATMALRLEKAFGASMEALMEMQLAHDIAQARARAGEIEVERYVPARSSAAQPRLI